jgi:hypothetical protein
MRPLSHWRNGWIESFEVALRSGFSISQLRENLFEVNVFLGARRSSSSGYPSRWSESDVPAPEPALARLLLEAVESCAVGPRETLRTPSVQPRKVTVLVVEMSFGTAAEI